MAGDESCASVPPHTACRLVTRVEARRTILPHGQCWRAQAVKTWLLTGRRIPPLLARATTGPYSSTTESCPKSRRKRIISDISRKALFRLDCRQQWVAAAPGGASTTRGKGPRPSPASKPKDDTEKEARDARSELGLNHWDVR